VLLLIPLLPFAGFVVNALIGRRLSKPAAAWVACGAMLGAVAAGGTAVWQLLALPPGSRVIDEVAFTWIEAGDLVVPLAFRLDPLGALMVAVVAGVGFLIHVYSVAYMHEERPSEYARYFSYLNLFASFMLILVLAANVPVMFVGWEGVGLCSYLLIGFWYHRPAAAAAGKKAFIVNRIGDFGFLLGMLLLFATFGTFDFRELAARIGPLDPELTFGTLSLAALLLFVGATGKSAQIPLYVWLPDAMEGPTPVSALIHAATMVTAGVYMIGRTAVLFSHAPEVLQIVAGVGLGTRRFLEHLDERTELSVELGNAREVQVHQGAAGDLSGFERVRQLSHAGAEPLDGPADRRRFPQGIGGLGHGGEARPFFICVEQAGRGLGPAPGLGAEPR